MQEFWWRLPFIKRLPPLWRGVLVIGLFDLLLSVCLAFWVRYDVADPRPEFLGDLAGVGATLFVAFVIEMTALVLWSTKYAPDDDALSGEGVGFGFAGLLGVGLALALANHSPAHNLTWLEQLGFAWSLVSLLILGLVVAAYPLLVYERNRPGSEPKTEKSS